MADFSDYLENELLDHVFAGASFSAPAAVYLALFTAAPSDAGGGTEVSTGGYAREEISFGTASSGTISNDTAVEFTASGGNFGTVTHVGIFDADTSGNLLTWKAITSVVINDGDTLTFPIGDIDVSLD